MENVTKELSTKNISKEDLIKEIENTKSYYSRCKKAASYFLIPLFFLGVGSGASTIQNSRLEKYFEITHPQEHSELIRLDKLNENIRSYLNNTSLFNQNKIDKNSELESMLYDMKCSRYDDLKKFYANFRKKSPIEYVGANIPKDIRSLGLQLGYSAFLIHATYFGSWLLYLRRKGEKLIERLNCYDSKR